MPLTFWYSGTRFFLFPHVNMHSLFFLSPMMWHIKLSYLLSLHLFFLNASFISFQHFLSSLFLFLFPFSFSFFSYLFSSYWLPILPITNLIDYYRYDIWNSYQLLIFVQTISKYEFNTFLTFVSNLCWIHIFVI